MKIYYVTVDRIGGFGSEYLTPGKKYLLHPIGVDSHGNMEGGWITNDTPQPAYILLNNCAHLEGGSWTLIEEETDAGQ